MPIVDAQLWTNTIDELGETVTLVVVTDTSYSDYGDATETTANTTGIKCMIEDISPEEMKETEGIFPNAEKRFFFKTSQTGITNGNRIIHDSITYEIVRVMKRQTAGITFNIEAWAKKT